MVAKIRRQGKEEKQKEGEHKQANCRPKWMNEEVEQAWEEKMQLSKAYTDAKKQKLGEEEIRDRRAAFNQAASDYHKVAEHSKQSQWDEFCRKSDPTDPTISSRFWKLAKEQKRVATGSGACPQQIRGPSGESLRTDEEKGRAFLERYTSQLQENGKETVRRAW